VRITPKGYNAAAVNPPAQRPLVVASVLGHRHVEMAILCLGSLRRLSAEPVMLRLHDDGSLDGRDRERLNEELGEPEIVSRAQADERTSEWLAPRPALRAFRRANPLALKLVDAMLWAGDELTYCDSDVLFLRPFTGLFQHLPDSGPGALFMTDRQNAYSLRSWHLLRYPRLRLPQRLNSGLIAFRAAGYDPDLLEWYLSRPELGFAPVWVEQTAWALLAGQVPCRLLDPLQVRIPFPGETPGAETAESTGTVALHFVSSVRSLLADYEDDSMAAGEPVVIRSLPARRCGAFDLAATEIRRRLAR
jgi:hypothetical protein